jgi:uncharacterized membrane protein required for colicin V production
VDKLSFHWFDLIVVVVLIVGILRGRKNGMSVEFMLLLQWLTTVIIAAIGYRALGMFIVRTTGITQLWGFIISYVTCAVVVSIAFTLLRRSSGGKLIGSDTFGSGEYYLGMTAGAIRFTCILMVFLALLNAKLYSPQQLEAEEKFQARWFEGIRFPTVGTTQHAVFKKSFVGRAVREFAGFLLIESSAPEQRHFKQKEFDVRGI